MTTSIVLTVIGRDHPGIVAALSDVLVRHGGNWAQSSMSSLAGQFAGILLATVPSGQAERCIRALEALDEQGLQVVAHAADGEAATSGGSVYSLDLVGHDRPGIVLEMTRALSRHGVNILELESEVASASMAGGPLFRARAMLELPDDVDLAALEQDLESIANELMVEFRREH